MKVLSAQLGSPQCSGTMFCTAMEKKTLWCPWIRRLIFARASALGFWKT